MNIYNYNVSDNDWDKIKFILKYLPDETSEFFKKYLSYYEKYRTKPSNTIYHVLSDIKRYSDFFREEFKKLDSVVEYDCKIGYSTANHILAIMGNLDKEHLVALSPLNLCLLITKTPVDMEVKEYLTKISMKFANEKIYALAEQEKEEFLICSDNKLMSQKNMEVQSYFRTCTAIYNLLLSKNTKFSKKEIHDLSLLLGMFYYTDSNKDYNIKEDFLKLFSDVISKEKILSFIGIDMNEDIVSFYNPISLINFEDDLNRNSIFSTLKALFGSKGSNSLISDLCNYLNIDDDELYDRLNILEENKKESLSDSELESRYLSMFKNKSIETVKIYNSASWIYNYLDKFKTSVYRNNPNKRRILSLLISLYLNNSEEVIYLENEGITLKVLLESTIHNTELLDRYLDVDRNTCERVVVHRLGNIPSDNNILKSLVLSNDKDIELLFIMLGKDINVIRSNIQNKRVELPKKSYQEEIELINTDKPMIDISSYSSISSYGNTIMNGVNNAINEVLHIINEDATTKRIDEIKSGVKSVYEERQISTPQKQSGLFSWLMLEAPEEEKKEVEVVIHFDYIHELEEKISKYSSDIDKQIFVYDWIQKRNIAYASKLKEYISVLERERERLIKDTPVIDSNDPSSLFKMQYFKTQLDLIDAKINSLKTSYMTMLQHFMAVDNAIRAHSVSSDALRKVMNDFMPLLSSNMLISEGMKTDKKANQIVKSIVDLTNSYLSNNVSDAKEILGSLEGIGLPEDKIFRIKSDLEVSTEEEDKSEKDEDNQIKLTL